MRPHYTLESFAILAITDGFDRVNFIDRSLGFHLDTWRPAESGKKGGGVYQDSPISDGRRLVFAKLEDAVETFTLKVNEKCTDQIYARQIRVLRSLIEKAETYFTSRYRSYFTETQPNGSTPTRTRRPVWIEALGVNESNMRYCVVKSGSLPEEENPYGPQMTQAVVMDGIDFIFERGQWQSTRPELVDGLPISAIELYASNIAGNADPITGDREPTTDADVVLISNKQQRSNLTHAYYYNSSVATYTSTLIQPPVLIFPPLPEAGDIAYFGIQNDASFFLDSPFSSLAFDLSQVQDGSLTIVWEYYDGVTPWATLDVRDWTKTVQPFDTLGPGSVHWRNPDDWVKVAVNGVTAWWVRARITAGGPGTSIEQDNLRFYTVGWSHTHIAPGAVLGDLTALSQIKITCLSDNAGVGGAAPVIQANRIMLGLRSLSRNSPNGLDFNPFFDAGQRQINISVTLGADTAYAASSEHWTNRIATFTAAGAEALATRVSWRVFAEDAPSWYGQFRVFARVRQNGGTGRQARLQFESKFGYGISTYLSERREIPIVGGFSLIDFGKFSTIPDDALGITLEGTVQSELNFYLYAETDAALSIDFFDLILMPCDEWWGDFKDTVGSQQSALIGGRRIMIDSAQSQHRDIRAVLDFADNIVGVWEPASNGRAMLQSARKANMPDDLGQRLWMLAARRFYAYPTYEEDDWRSNHEFTASIQMFDTQRYKGARGDG